MPNMAGHLLIGTHGTAKVTVPLREGDDVAVVVGTISRAMSPKVARTIVWTVKEPRGEKEATSAHQHAVRDEGPVPVRVGEPASR